MKIPEALLLKVTVPVGMPAVPGEASETVALQVEGVGPFKVSGLGVQVTAIELVRFRTVRLEVPELDR